MWCLGKGVVLIKDIMGVQRVSFIIDETIKHSSCIVLIKDIMGVQGVVSFLVLHN
jgi:hypothetical protein